MLGSANSPPLYTSPHTQPARRDSPRHQANTHSPRLRSKKSSIEDPTATAAYGAIPSATAQVASSHFSQPPPKPETADHGTQYSPPDWPPTSSRSSLRKLVQDQPAPSFHTSIPQIATSSAANVAPSAVASSAAQDSGPYVTSVPQNVSQVGNAPSEVAPAAAGAVAGRPAQEAHSARRTHTAMTGIPSDSSTRTNSPAGVQRSRSKRARSQVANKKMMPADYAACDPKDLATLIASMLMELIRYNDDIPLGNNQLTRFHSRAPPGISVKDYLIRLTHHATLPPPILLSMVYYIDKLCLLYPAFTINSLTVHRFLITAATVASKGLSDSFWTNNTYARVGGVTVKELALLELEFLQRVDWRIVPNSESLVDYYRNLIQRTDEWFIEGEEDDSEEDDDEEMGDEGDVESSGSSGSAERNTGETMDVEQEQGRG